MNAWSPLEFFEGENESELIDRFVELRAKHKDNFTAFDVANYIFKNLPNSTIRAHQAAKYWSESIEIQERIHKKQMFCEAESDKDNLIKIAMSIATDPTQNAKDRIAALELVGKLRGEIIKPIEKTVKHEGGSGIPSIVFKLREDD